MSFNKPSGRCCTCFSLPLHTLSCCEFLATPFLPLIPPPSFSLPNPVCAHATLTPRPFVIENKSLAMYYNGYIIICIFIGAFLGSFLFQWEQLNIG
jgi:hypothetical protein